MYINYIGENTKIMKIKGHTTLQPTQGRDTNFATTPIMWRLLELLLTQDIRVPSPEARTVSQFFLYKEDANRNNMFRTYLPVIKFKLCEEVASLCLGFLTLGRIEILIQFHKKRIVATVLSECDTASYRDTVVTKYSETCFRVLQSKCVLGVGGKDSGVAWCRLPS
jgi:hypothetical protein